MPTEDIRIEDYLARKRRAASSRNAIEVTNRNDPRLLAYNDSLSTYRMGESSVNVLRNARNFEELNWDDVGPIEKQGWGAYRRLKNLNNQEPEMGRVIKHFGQETAIASVFAPPQQPYVFKKPVPRETIQRMEPRTPIPPSSFARTPISVPQPSYTRPSYKFTPGFVDPRVAASARQSVADDELLTPKQLEYRRRLRMRQATPMTF